MKSTSLKIPGLILLEPKLYPDERGYFFESFNEHVVNTLLGGDVHFVQDNQSYSHRNIIRGLHFQVPPKAQGKLVRVIQGKIWDVAVDIRQDSPTFGEWEAVELSAENKNQLWIPAGFAHGFLTLSDFAEVLYKTTDYYAPECERILRWDDPSLGIPWPSEGKIISSERDAKGLFLRELAKDCGYVARSV